MSGRGMVLGGDITSGTIKEGMQVLLPTDHPRFQSSSIIGVSIGRRSDGRQDLVGLLLAYTDEADEAYLRGLELEGKAVEVIDAPEESESNAWTK